MTIEQTLLSYVFPEQTFEYFNAVKATRDDQAIQVVFEEKNIPPPHGPEHKLIAKGFTDITVTDFPIQGRKTLLTFRRRYWQIEGQPGIIKNDIKLVFPGTKLAQAFADFLKEGSGD